VSDAVPKENRLRFHREQLGWTQAELAQRAGISRPAVSAIEIGRVAPSIDIALALSDALNVEVRELFAPEAGPRTGPQWAWPPACDPSRYWHAEIGGRVLLYPVEATAGGTLSHDGLQRGGHVAPNRLRLPQQSLVMASCDPAAALLMEQFHLQTPFRLIVLPRSSGDALQLLGRGQVHVAGVHLVKAGQAKGNAAQIRARLGGGYSVLHVAHWLEGVVVSPALGIKSIAGIQRQKLRWVGRELGSGARECLDEVLQGRASPRLQARDHRGVAEAIRCGFADAGVCLKLSSEEAGLKFFGVRKDEYDVCYRTSQAADPRIKALVDVVRSSAYQTLMSELPGYDVRTSADVELIA
jgi:molybdate-binding protein/DNA-binding XRE family transcriptional regulator